jgi:hypothetical protein
MGPLGWVQLVRNPMTYTHQNPPPAGLTEPLRPWLARDDRIIQFLADDGQLYASQHHLLSAISPAADRLEVEAPPHGTLIITGPAARELCASLCASRATMIRADHTDIESVTLVPEEAEI